jgi:hypothetical protein
MSLLTSSIDLDTIAVPISITNAQFPPSQIECLANLFLKAGDTISPILLRKISPIAFEVLEGHFEYYAALKAQEINDQFTAIRAYVVPPDLESTILEQYNFLRSHSTSAPQAQPDLAQNLAQMETAIANRLEQKLSTTIDRIVEERINSSLQVFANQITQQLNSHLLDFKQSLSFVPISQVLSPPQAIDTIPESEPKSKTTKAVSPKTKTTSSKSKAKDTSINNDDPQVLQVLHDLNTMNFADLERKLSQSKSTKFTRLIHEQRLLRSQQKFESIQDVIANVQGLAEKTMQKIVAAW